MAYTRVPVPVRRSRPRARPRFRAGLPSSLGDNCSDASDCLSRCDSAANPDNGGPGYADPSYAACNSNCASTYPCNPGASGSGSGTTTTSSSSGSSIAGNIGAATGGLLSTLLRPVTPMMPAGIDPTTILLLGGGLIAVVMLTRKRD